MALDLLLPEGPALRRLAGALATAGRPVAPAAVLDDRMAVGRYFALFPWRGEKLAPVKVVASFRRDTVGAYFAAFNWKGLPLDSETAEQADTVPVSDQVETQRADARPRKDAEDSKDSMDQFFTSLFD